jgi:hypothetical protein
MLAGRLDLDRPALQLLAEHPELTQNARSGYTIQVRGATHLSFMDVPLLPLPDDSPVEPMLAATQVEPTRMWWVTCDVLLAFFAHHLDQAAIAPLLTGPFGDDPELTFGAP